MLKGLFSGSLSVAVFVYMAQKSWVQMMHIVARKPFGIARLNYQCDVGRPTKMKGLHTSQLLPLDSFDPKQSIFGWIKLNAWKIAQSSQVKS